MLEPDVEQPRDLRGRHVQARKFEKRVAETKRVEIDRSGESDHGQTSLSAPAELPGEERLEHPSTRSARVYGVFVARLEHADSRHDMQPC